MFLYILAGVFTLGYIILIIFDKKKGDQFMFDIVMDLILQFIQIVPVFLVVLMFCGLLSGWFK